MNVMLYHKHFSAQHLDEVKQEMIKRGTPTIKAVWSEAYGMWMAIEGCHRIRAAKALGLTPVIKDVTNQKTVTIQMDGENKKIAVSALIEMLNDSAAKTDYIVFED